ncbi:MAG: hypothetical protein WBB29_19385 [Geitlerinemataceae cyanobacterium]
MSQNSQYPRGKHPNTLAKLPDRSAPDKPGETVAITVKITLEQKAWLSTQAESQSYHVRQALNLYLKTLKTAETE